MIKNFESLRVAFEILNSPPELGMRVEESDVLPNLRETDTYVECKFCSQRFECDSAAAVGKKYIKTTRSLEKIKHTSLRLDTYHVDGK